MWSCQTVVVKQKCLPRHCKEFFRLKFSGYYSRWSFVSIPFYSPILLFSGLLSQFVFSAIFQTPCTPCVFFPHHLWINIVACSLPTIGLASYSLAPHRRASSLWPKEAIKGCIRALIRSLPNKWLATCAQKSIINLVNTIYIYVVGGNQNILSFYCGVQRVLRRLGSHVCSNCRCISGRTGSSLSAQSIEMTIWFANLQII